MAYNRSNFPEGGYDLFDENYDPSYPQLLELNEWQKLKEKSSRTNAEETRYQELTTQYARYIFTPEKLNKLQDVITSTQKFTYETITNYYKFMGEHDILTNYKAFNTVRYNGDGYLALQDNVGVLPTNTTVWLQIGGKGDQGERGLAGMGLVFKGAYNNSIAYNIQDAVRYNNKIYYCKQASVGNLPTNTTYWELFLDPSSIILFITQNTQPSNYAGQTWINTDI